jgi:nucleoside-diphosphate-sugar epimerase
MLGHRSTGTTVLVTGAGGHLGLLVAEGLAADGHRLRLLDQVARRPIDALGEALVGDLAEPGVCRSAVAGVAGVVHLAALHGIHLADHGPSAFWRTNATGTFELLLAARAAGVRWFVFASSIGVYGDAVGWLDEGVAGRPVDVYQLTKIVDEQIVDFARTQWSLASVCLRLGIFVPVPPPDEQRRLLAGGVAPTDVTEAIVRVTRRLIAGGSLPPALNVVAPVPFVAADLKELGRNPSRVVQGYFPEAESRSDLAGLDPIVSIYPTDALGATLGWQPEVRFSPLLTQSDL